MVDKPTIRQTFADDDEFLAALEKATKLFEDGDLRWRVKPDCSVICSLDDEVLERVFDDDDARSKFKKIVGVDISWAMTAAANGQPIHQIQDFVGTVLRNKLSFPLSEEENEFLSTRVELVKRNLYRRSLRERVLIRRTCKKEVFNSLQWDINIKKHDLGEGTLDDIPYATVEFKTSKPVNDSLSFLFGERNDREAIVFDCHVDDLDDLLKDLAILRDNLRLLTQAGRDDGEDR